MSEKMSWEQVSPFVGDIAIGGLSGYATGYFARKFFRLACIVIGAYLASLLYLGSRGYLTINWDKVVSSADGILSSIGGLSLGISIMGVGAVGGAIMGWRSG